MSKTMKEVLPELQAIAKEMGVTLNDYKVVQEYQKRQTEIKNAL